jgi:hypothetical protein
VHNSLNIRLFAQAFAAALVLALVTASQGQTNLVINGSFESGPAGERTFTGWSLVGPANNFSDYGVAQSSTPPEVAEQGNYFAYFRGHPTDDSQDCLGNYVSLKMGALYHISYYLGTDGPLTNGAALWAIIGPYYTISDQDAMLTAYYPNSATALPYQNFSTLYLATSSNPILSFHGINATNGLAVTNGILLDNISMTLAYPLLTLNVSPPFSLVFSWPYTNSPYRLQANASLLASNWVTLSNAPVNVGTNNQITLLAPAVTQFYRLTLP